MSTLPDNEVVNSFVTEIRNYYRCSICEAVYPLRNNLKQHIRKQRHQEIAARQNVNVCSNISIDFQQHFEIETGKHFGSNRPFRSTLKIENTCR